MYGVCRKGTSTFSIFVCVASLIYPPYSSAAHTAGGGVGLAISKFHLTQTATLPSHSIYISKVQSCTIEQIDHELPTICS